MSNVEYRARIQKNYVITRYEEGRGSITCGTYPTLEQAETAGRAFAAASGGHYTPYGSTGIAKPTVDA
jgi:hypothetical protein